ncbi:MAG: PAS domain-containing protein [Kiritimatiellae bacterium]|nr:PAS domain-containing protein [Kiritimatiellia bacterium]MDD4735338.1 PAS domain-containing protein [Kiritimatiellia bacterium]
MDRMYALLESIHDGALVVDREGVIRRANEQALSYLGVSLLELQGARLSDWFTHTTAPEWKLLRERTKKISFVMQEQALIRDPDAVFQLVISCVQTGSGESCILFHPQSAGNSDDDVRIAMEVKFLTLFDYSTDGLALFEQSSLKGGRPKLIMCNDSYVRMAGRSRQELMRADIEQLIEPVPSRSTGLGGEEDDFERIFSWSRPDGIENYVASRMVPVELGDRHYVYSINHDITARRHMEEMFRREHCAVENAGTGIAILDTNFIITYLNPAAVRMLGYDYSGELLGNAAIRIWADPMECQQLLQVVQDSGENSTAETQMLRKDSTAFEAEISIACNFDNDGIMRGLVLSLVDISDRKKAEQQKAMIASLGAACHHLGQPAQILMANLAMMKMNYQGDPELIDSCEEAMDRIGEILRKLGSVTEYKTVPYAQGQDHRSDDVILDI